MPEMSKKFVPKHFGDKNPNPKLIRLVRKITDRIPGKIKMTTEAPEYWGLACIFEDEMDPVTREASLDFLWDLISHKAFTVREHHKYGELVECSKFESAREVFKKLRDEERHHTVAIAKKIAAMQEG